MLMRPGSAVIEVLISLSLAAFLIAVLGNLISSTRRLETAQDFRQRALTHTRESLEMVTSLQNELFACTNPSPGPGTCTRADGQTCALAPAYNSCWTNYAYGLASNSPLHLAPQGGSWQLVTGSESVSTDTAFTRSLTITNLERDASGQLVESGGTPDPNTKKVTVQVSWQERGQSKNFELSTILTAWSNFTP